MSQLIITTDISTIRPVFAQGASENIKRYNQLKKLFETDKEYQVFAEPIPGGEQKIAWHTEFKGEAIPYAELSENQQEKAKKRLKYQVNRLYKAILKIVKHSNKNTKELYDLLDACIEIPNYNDIYVIQNQSGQNNFCIIRWGFTSDDFKAQSGLIAKLIPLKVATINIKAINSDKSIAPNETIFIEHNGQIKEMQTDKTGMLYLEDFPLMTEFVAFQKNKKNEKIYEHNYQNDETIEFIFQIGELIKEPPKQNVIIITKDEGNSSAENILLDIYSDEIKIQKKSAENGEILLGELSTETVINCTQLIDGKSSNNQKFTIVQGTEIYIFNAKKPATSGNMNIKLVDEKNRIIPNAKIKVFYKDKIIEKTTDENGYVSIKDIPFNEEIKCQQIIDNVSRHEQIFSYTKENNNYTMRGSVPRPPAKYSFIEIQVVNRSKEPIKNLKITIDNGSNSYNLFSNEEGKVSVKDINCANKVIIKTEYQKKKYENNFYCQENNEFHQIVLGRKKGLFWLWLIPLLLLLVALFYFFILPLLQNLDKDDITIVDTVQVIDTTHIIDTIKPEIKYKGINIIIIDKETNKPLENAQVQIEYQSKLDSNRTNEKGISNFADVPEKKIEISVIINAKGFTEQRATFMFVNEKTFYLSDESIDISEIEVQCGQTIDSKGYGSTIKTVNIKKSSGRLRIIFDMFSIADELIVYTGKASEISDDKILWKTRGYVRGLHKENFKFNAPDSLITIKINGGDENKTEWYFKVYCP